MVEEFIGAETGPWDASDVFPERPENASDYGYMSSGGKLQSCSRERLEQVVGPDVTLANASLVWSPETPRLVPPGDVPFLKKEIRKSAKENIKVEFFNGFMWILLWGSMLLFQEKGTSLFAVLLVLTGVLPLISAIKNWRLIRIRNANPVLMEEAATAARRIGRYKAWISMRPSRFTKWMVLAIVVIGIAQIFIGLEDSVSRAGILKPVTFEGQQWRLLTGPLLHGGLLHLMFNAAALFGLGKIVEALAGRGYAAVVFLLTALVGSLCSVIFLPSIPSVGASGGILGLVGFLAVFAFKFKSTIPMPLFKLLLQILVIIGIAGLVASDYIDNAAHVGGALSGTLLGVFIIPEKRIIPLPYNGWLGVFAEFVLAVGVVLTLVLLLA